MTYNVFGGTLSLTQSINQSVLFMVAELLVMFIVSRRHCLCHADSKEHLLCVCM